MARAAWTARVGSSWWDIGAPNTAIKVQPKVCETSLAQKEQITFVIDKELPHKPVIAEDYTLHDAKYL